MFLAQEAVFVNAFTLWSCDGYFTLSLYQKKTITLNHFKYIGQ